VSLVRVAAGCRRRLSACLSKVLRIAGRMSVHWIAERGRVELPRTFGLVRSRIGCRRLLSACLSKCAPSVRRRSLLEEPSFSGCQSSWPRYLDDHSPKHSNWILTRRHYNPRRRRWRQWGARCVGRCVLGGSSVYLLLTRWRQCTRARSRVKQAVKNFFVAGSWRELAPAKRLLVARGSANWVARCPGAGVEITGVLIGGSLALR
jgi:hypothetical protein